MDHLRTPLRLNVGFIIKESIGYSRSFPFEYDHIHFEPDLDLVKFHGTAEITRTPQGLLVQANLYGLYAGECGRCLKPLPFPLHAKFAELYALSQRHVTESGLILPEDGHIDLDPLAREYLILEIPINQICEEDCKGLCPVCGENLNQRDCGHRPEDIDPRFSVLKNLLSDH
ncbi:MAG TPA: DUF177 domain-containing protein [Anaerolineales bacterium]|nr:DUF177 domain-containing protein [Anaerolineales bacterium]